jgi:hypothetical protein
VVRARKRSASASDRSSIALKRAGGFPPASDGPRQSQRLSPMS